MRLIIQTMIISDDTLPIDYHCGQVMVAVINTRLRMQAGMPTPRILWINFQRRAPPTSRGGLPVNVTRTVLHALFGIQEKYEFTIKLSDVAVKAALDIVNVCNEHAKIMAGRSNTIYSTSNYVRRSTCN